MNVRIHFENLSAGMKAKLDPSHRANSNSVLNLRKSYGNSPSSLGDATGKHRLSLTSGKKYL